MEALAGEDNKIADCRLQIADWRLTITKLQILRLPIGIADSGPPVEDTRVAFRYRPEVLDALARHGLAPRAETSPQLLRDAINDLYRYEIRRLRQRLLRKEFPKEAYVPKVLELRAKYLLLSVPIEEWSP
jgi:hypothetical protein